MRPLLIADIDGTFAHVVNVMAFIKPHLHPAFPTAIQELNKFCAETSALVAPISARLRVQPAKYFEKTMRDAGFTGEFHSRIAVPRSWRPFSRGKDLARFMEEEHIPLEELVIADDQPRYYTQAQMSRLVQPQSEKGFDELNRVEATLILAGENTGAWKELQRFGGHDYAWGTRIESPRVTTVSFDITDPNHHHNVPEYYRHSMSWRTRVQEAQAPTGAKSK